MIAPSLEVLYGWGMANFARSWVYRPRAAEEVADALADAERRGLTVCHRGAGQSYGDAALNQGGAVVLLAGLDRITDFDPEHGLVRVEAGVTIRQLWRYILPSGWWPPVVPGTMEATVGGCVAMNVHGKNHYQAGPIGDHVNGLTLLEPSGGVSRLTPEQDARRLATVIGAQGLTGTILDVSLRLRRVHSGYLDVHARPVRALDEALERLDAASHASDDAVGWLDCFARGTALGRGLLHSARYLPPDHALAGQGLDLATQALPARLFGVVPVRHGPRLLRPILRRGGVRALNLAKYRLAALGGPRSFVQPLAAFHFLLDSIPNWESAYGPHGLIQYQLFVPREAALPVFRAAIEAQQRRGIISPLAVLKRHRQDRYAASYAVDGFSLALDLAVHPRTATALMALCQELDALLREAGGRIYAAKDAVSQGVLPSVRHPRFSSNLVRRWARGGDEVSRAAGVDCFGSV